MEILVYTTQTCPWCKKVKEWFKSKRIKFTELDVTEEDKYRDQLIEKSSQLSVPVIDIDGEIIIGFDEKELETAVQKAKDKKKEKS